MAAATAATIGIASPAFAAVQFSSYSGADLPTKIKASTTNTATDNVSTVWGCTQNDGACANVSFTGRRQDSSTLENIRITDGAGFASITDSPLNSSNQLYELLIDPANDFNQYMFSLQLVNDGTVFVYYMLASGGGWQQATPLAGIGQSANANRTYLVSGDVMTAIYVRSNSPFKEFKQNSITFGSVPAPVPEPATWALMLLGFGGMGMALRRSRRRGKQTLMQIA
jgi:hypothetical protein